MPQASLWGFSDGQERKGTSEDPADKALPALGKGKEEDRGWTSGLIFWSTKDCQSLEQGVCCGGLAGIASAPKEMFSGATKMHLVSYLPAVQLYLRVWLLGVPSADINFISPRA